MRSSLRLVRAEYSKPMLKNVVGSRNLSPNLRLYRGSKLRVQRNGSPFKPYFRPILRLRWLEPDVPSSVLRSVQSGRLAQMNPSVTGQRLEAE
jgi:hypothetical protein